VEAQERLVLNVRKPANAFVPNAAPSRFVPSAALGAIARFHRKQGGLWVGGTLSVSPAGVSFTPNALNMALHDGLQPIDVPAKTIRTVRHEVGWFTSIVVIGHDKGEFRFRCYGAKRLAASISHAFNVKQPTPASP
jgi:hypothetical protein